MNNDIVEKWNSVVGEWDTTYILGDIAFTSVTETFKLIDRLNGAKILIIGNHDKQIVKADNVLRHFYSIHDYLEIKHKGIKVVLFHFPIAEWNQIHRGAIHFHGHLHGKPSYVEGRIKDVSIDENGLYPFSLDDLIDEMVKLPIRPHGDSKENGKYE